MPILYFYRYWKIVFQNGSINLHCQHQGMGDRFPCILVNTIINLFYILITQKYFVGISFTFSWLLRHWTTCVLCCHFNRLSFSCLFLKILLIIWVPLCLLYILYLLYPNMLYLLNLFIQLLLGMFLFLYCQT